MRQGDKISTRKDPTDDKWFLSVLKIMQYIGVHLRPDICPNTQRIGPGSEPITGAEKKRFAKTLQNMK